MTSLSEWLAHREPPVPAPFAEYLAASDPAAGVTVAALADEADRALRLALEGGGRERSGAFDLLAADGFLTYAAELALEEADPTSTLRDLVRRFGE